MSSTALPVPALSGRSSLGSMAAIESRRFARHPAFVIGVLLAFVVVARVYRSAGDDPAWHDMLSMPIVPAFFIGLPSLVAANRLTRSTEAAEEAMGAAPGTEARRTTALAAACLVPFAAGLLWTAVAVGLALHKGATAQDWWFGTMPDWQVWSVLLAEGPVACLGGALLGVLSARWLHFPGSAAVVVVATVVIVYVAMGLLAYNGGSHSELRLWIPWPGYHSGTQGDRTQILYAGNPAFSLLYSLCLCAAATLAALWHDRAARTRQLRLAFVGVVVLGLVALVLAMTTGFHTELHSGPIPWLKSST
jgi:hypothetical protein